MVVKLVLLLKKIKKTNKTTTKNLAGDVLYLYFQFYGLIYITPWMVIFCPLDSGFL